LQSYRGARAIDAEVSVVSKAKLPVDDEESSWQKRDEETRSR